MRFELGNRVFTARPAAVACVLVVLAVCISLGYWQIGRAREKQALLDAFDRGTRTAVDLADVDTGRLARYQHVRVRGHYLPERQMLIDNMPSAVGEAGYRVLTPLERADGRGVLIVDRGWVPMGPTRERLPDVAVGAQPREVSGRLDVLPVPGVRVGAASLAGDASWPRVLLFPTIADVETVLGTRVAPRIVLLDAGLPDGYERKWRPSIGFGPERHLGYALQWFALAATAIVGFVAMGMRRNVVTPGAEP